VNAIGDTLDLPSATVILDNLVQAGHISAAAANILLTAIGTAALAPVAPADRARLRARIFKLCLLEAAKGRE